MRIITLTTDFGLRDGFVGAVKGVILGIAPGVQIVDISHSIAAQNIQEGSFALWRACSFFPKDTIHVYVVDPGVGTMRRALGARVGDHYFVGPDNGLLTPLMEDAELDGNPMEFVNLDNSKYWLPRVSNTFHGRDVFAPVAAHLATGVALGVMGTLLKDPIRLKLSRPEKIEKGWRAHITVIDIFGNLTTDLPSRALHGRIDVLFRILGAEIKGLVDSYGHRTLGELVALVDSEDYIELALVNGNAAERLGANVGDTVEVILSE